MKITNLKNRIKDGNIYVYIFDFFTFEIYLYISFNDLSDGELNSS